jgi:hypothetical protein
MSRTKKFLLAATAFAVVVAGGISLAVAASGGTPPGPPESLLETELLDQATCTTWNNAGCYDEVNAASVTCDGLRPYSRSNWVFTGADNDLDNEISCNVYDIQGDYFGDIFVYPRPGTPAPKADSLMGNPPWQAGGQWRFKTAWEDVANGYNKDCDCFPDGVNPPVWPPDGSGYPETPFGSGY